MRFLCLAALVVALFTVTGCATIMGTATGALTGAVDMPAEAYRHNKMDFENQPMLYGLDVLFLSPVGIVLGPLTGFVKGVSLDVGWIAGKVSYGDVFLSYREASIWRPHTYYWPTKTEQAAQAQELQDATPLPSEAETP